MKLLVIFLMMATANPQDGSNRLMDAVIAVEQDNKKEITVQELPEPVVTAFQESEYGEWTVEKVYLIKSETDTTYELHLLQEDEKLVLLSDAEGNLQTKVAG